MKGFQALRPLVPSSLSHLVEGFKSLKVEELKGFQSLSLLVPPSLSLSVQYEMVEKKLNG